MHEWLTLPPPPKKPPHPQRKRLSHAVTPPTKKILHLPGKLRLEPSIVGGIVTVRTRQPPSVYDYGLSHHFPPGPWGVVADFAHHAAGKRISFMNLLCINHEQITLHLSTFETGFLSKECLSHSPMGRRSPWAVHAKKPPKKTSFPTPPQKGAIAL